MSLFLCWMGGNEMYSLAVWGWDYVKGEGYLEMGLAYLFPFSS